MVAEPRTSPPTASPTRLMTIADYEALPDDGRRYELIDGDLIEMPAPSLTHQRFSIRLAARLLQYAEENGLGEVIEAPFDVELPGPDVVQPDILFVSSARLDRLTDRRMVGGPDLVVEIASPSTASHDLGRKRRMYRQAGVGEFWFVDLDARVVTVWRLVNGQYVEVVPDEGGRVHSAVLPGFSVAVAPLFAAAHRQR